ncbi:MAG: hypothetical protein WBI07_01010 [Mobilitalea sp.]
MSNIFKKLIRKELGKENYNLYSSHVKKNKDAQKSNAEMIYNHIYENLKNKDLKAITIMHKRLNDTMVLAFRISRNFVIAFIAYLIASIVLIVQVPKPELALAAIILLSICFVYKTYEFIAIKFCYVDAQIILVYKAVLDKIIIGDNKNRPLQGR